MLNIHKIVARDIPDLWFQAVNDILDHGRRFTVDKGSYSGQTRLEYDYFMGHILFPGTEPLLPDIPAHYGIPNPVDYNYVFGGEGYEQSYIEYLMSGNKKEDEVYTYGERLTCYVSDDMPMDAKHFPDTNKTHIKTKGALDQVLYICECYKNHGYRNNQMVLQVARPQDIFLDDPPCLRHIDTRIQDDKLHFFVYFRSWDLFGGLPANLAGISVLQKYMADEIGVEQGEMIVESKGLHLYGYAEELAKIRCMKL